MSKRLLRIAMALSLVSACLINLPQKSMAQTLPQTGHVVDGQATISALNTNQLLINQSSQNAIINWQKFSVGAGDQIHFNNGSGATLNRVTGTSQSDIFGTLSATGSLFLINHNGIVFGSSGVVRTGGSFVASTLDVSDSQFMRNGDLLFGGSSNAEVINYGTISALGGDVALIGLSVTNEGAIDAPNGTAALVSGREILMSDTQTADGKFFIRVGSADSSTTNKGTIRAATAELRANGGNVYALAGNRGGAINATGITRQGGRIFLTAPGGRVVTSSGIRARRPRTPQPTSNTPVTGQDGGEIIVDAEFVSLGSPLDADGYNGGLITVRAHSLSLAEPITARGINGIGGHIELNVSGDTLATSTSIIDASGYGAGGSIRHVTGQTLTTSGSYIVSSQSGIGGNIDVSGGAMRLLSASFDASGYTGGGRIRLGGEAGGGSGLIQDELPNALRLAMTDATTITGDAIGPDGDGGTIITWADERAAVLGQFSARPGTLSGAGGFVEISSSGELIYRAEVETGRGGRNGTVLLDPQNITIADVSFDQSIFILGSGYSSPNLSTSLDDNDQLGVSISLDGNRLAVGAIGDDGFGNSSSNSGAVYLFTFSDENFSGGRLAGIVGKGYVGGNNVDLSVLDAGDQFGFGVSLDGNRLAAGALDDDGAGNSAANTGAVHLITFSDDVFSNGTLSATIGHGYTGPRDVDLSGFLDSSDAFAQKVSLDGNLLAIGAGADDGAGTGGAANVGAVYLLSFADQAFNGGQLRAVIGNGYVGGNNLDMTGTLVSGDIFGIGLSLDGNRVAVGASQDDGAGINTGAAYLFTFTDQTFSGLTLEATIGANFTGPNDINLAANLDVNDQFGTSLSLQGNRLAVGAQLDDGQNNNADFTGAVYLFTFADQTFTGGNLAGIIGNGYTGGNNVDVQNLASGDSHRLSVSLDGNRLVMGSSGDDAQGNIATDTGAAYLFTFTDDQFNGGQLRGIIGAGYDSLASGGNIDLSANLNSGDLFGSAISLDGTRLAVGAHADDNVSNSAFNTGAVYLFSFTDNAFSGGVLEAVIGKGYAGGKNVDVASLESTDEFGRSVSLDGNRLAVGAPLEDGAGNATSQSGAVYLFSFTDSTFNGGTLEATIGKGYTGGKNIDVAAVGVSDQFGMGVSLDGNRLAIGSRRDDGAANTRNHTGAVYLFSFTDGAFSGGALEATIGKNYVGSMDINVAGLDNLDLFGASVSLDGNRLAVGAVDDDSPGNTTNSSGAVYLFSFTDNAFNGGVLEATIGRGYTGGKNIDVAALETGDRFGLSVSLDGNRLAVGAVNDDGLGNATLDSGAVYLFSFADSTFSSGTLVATIGKGYTGGKNIDITGLENSDEFGASVSLNGNRLAVGARFDDGVGNSSVDSGAVYLFTDPFGLGTASPVTDGGFGIRMGESITITPDSITALLNGGNNVVLQASNDLTVIDAILANNPGGNGGDLTFQTGRGIFINANITTDNGNFTLIGNDTAASGVVDGDRLAGTADIVIASGITINLGDGRFTSELRDGTGNTNRDGGVIRIGGTITGQQLEFNNLSGNGTREVILDAGASLTATDAGEAIVFSSGLFTNNAGAGALTFTGGGRSIIYSSDYELDNLGGLTGTFIYNQTSTTAPPNTITQTGAVFVYERQPILTITANDATREYGAGDPAFGITVTGLVNGDSQATAISSGTAGFSTTTNLSSNVGSYVGDIQSGIGSLTSDIGYGFAFAPGTLSITLAPLLSSANQSHPVEARSISHIFNPLIQAFDEATMRTGSSVSHTRNDPPVVSVDFNESGPEIQFEMSGKAQPCFANPGANSACQFLPTIILREISP